MILSSSWALSLSCARSSAATWLASSSCCDLSVRQPVENVERNVSDTIANTQLADRELRVFDRPGAKLVWCITAG